MLRNQEDMNKCQARYDVCLNPGIKVEFCPHGIDVSQALPNGGVYMHPQVLALGLRLLMMRFVLSILTFYRFAPSQLSGVAWCMVFGLEALCTLNVLETC